VGTKQVKFQVSRFTIVGGEGGDGCTHDVIPDPLTKFLNSPFCFALERTMPIWIQIIIMNDY